MIDDTLNTRAVLELFARRLSTFGPVDDSDAEAVVNLESDGVSRPRGADVTSQLTLGPHIVVGGWACRMRPSEKRRRQIFGFYIPGDVIGSFWPNRPVAPFQVTALTRLSLVPAAALVAESPDGSPVRGVLTMAARRAEDHSELRLFDHMARLVERDAYRGLASLLLELHDRLAGIGLAIDGAFRLPIGQRVLAQAMGLSLAHTNHTLRRLRAEGLFEVRGNMVRLLDPERLRPLTSALRD